MVALNKCLEGIGVGDLMDADVWGVAWAVFAVIAGAGLAVAANALGGHVKFMDSLEFDGGYNALAPITDR
jgi:hypothetical protein